MIFEAAGLGDYVAEGLAILFVLDWFVDRIETSVNVTSDQFVAKIIDDISINSEKKSMDIRCGCCLFAGDPNASPKQRRTKYTLIPRPPLIKERSDLNEKINA